jgi:hypothetical protein
MPDIKQIGMVGRQQRATPERKPIPIRRIEFVDVAETSADAVAAQRAGIARMYGPGSREENVEAGIKELRSASESWVRIERYLLGKAALFHNGTGRNARMAATAATLRRQEADMLVEGAIRFNGPVMLDRSTGRVVVVPIPEAGAAARRARLELAPVP